jgi:hypothetical protein
LRDKADHGIDVTFADELYWSASCE